MYLDHVTDSMLKGIGEHVFSMWVNIFDSLLSVALVWLLIPIFDVFGYALVIILMELFNFTLSFLRLRKRVEFRIDLVRSLLLPLVSSLLSAWLAKRAFCFSGRQVSGVWLTAQIAFSVCVFIVLMMLEELFINALNGK